MWKEVTRGKGTDFFKLRDYEGQLAEGQRGRIDLDLRIEMPDTIQRILQSRLEQAGMEDVSVESGSKVLHIIGRKAFPFLALIVTAVLALAILIVSWRFFKEVAEVMPKGVMIGGAVVLIILAVLFAVWFARGQVAAVTGGA